MQRYKVFIYDSPVFFGNIKSFTEKMDVELNWEEINQEEFVQDIKDKKFEGKNVLVIVSDVQKGFEEFSSYFKKIEAAGGLVYKGDCLLVIKRLGRTDLPKGKLEEGESIEECAIREVEEECGIDQIEIVKVLENTYHCYEMRGKWMVKTTYWYEMISKTQLEPKPQVEEDIEWVKWISKDEIKEVMKDTYPSLIQVVNTAL